MSSTPKIISTAFIYLYLRKSFLTSCVFYHIQTEKIKTFFKRIDISEKFGYNNTYAE